MLGSYGYSMGSMPTSFRPGETLIGTAATEKRTILVENAPRGYLKIASGLGEAPPAQVIVLPVLFEGKVLGVIELASFQPFTQIQQDFLNQIAEMIATSVNTISRQHQDRGAALAVAGADRATAGALGRVGEPAEGAAGRPTPSWRRRPSCSPSRTATSRSRTPRSKRPGRSWRSAPSSSRSRCATSPSSWRTCRTSCVRR